MHATSLLKALYYRLKARRGACKAAVALGRTILQAAYYMIQRGQTYVEMGGNYFDRVDKVRTAKRLIRRLEAMGLKVEIVAEEKPMLLQMPVPIST